MPHAPRRDRLLNEVVLHFVSPRPVVENLLRGRIAGVFERNVLRDDVPEHYRCADAELAFAHFSDVDVMCVHCDVVLAGLLLAEVRADVDQALVEAGLVAAVEIFRARDPRIDAVESQIRDDERGDERPEHRGARPWPDAGDATIVQLKRGERAPDEKRGYRDEITRVWVRPVQAEQGGVDERGRENPLP